MSYYGAVEEIKKLDVNDPEYFDHVACIIKKSEHFVKLSVYQRMFMYMKYGPRRPRAFKKHVKNFTHEFLADKIQTHIEFTGRDVRKQIYGLFDWKKQ